MPSPPSETRADPLVTAVTEALARGDASAPVVPAYAALLEVADEHYAHGETKEAAQSFTEALRLATHRVLHFDNLTSPLADDPTGFTAPLRDSVVAKAMRAARGRVSTGSTTREQLDHPRRLDRSQGPAAGGGAHQRRLPERDP